jgi:hypothetical protein
MEIIRSTVARVQVCSGSGQIEIRLGNDAFEIEDLRGVMACVGVYSFYGTREKVVDGRAERSNNRVGVRMWFYRTRPVGFFGCEQRVRQSGVKYKACTRKPGRTPNEAASGNAHVVLLSREWSLVIGIGPKIVSLGWKLLSDDSNPGKGLP